VETAKRVTGSGVSSLAAATADYPTKKEDERSTKLILAVGVCLGIAMLGAFINSLNTSTPRNTAGCLDIATAKPALDNAAARLDASVAAAKMGNITTAASEMRSAAASLRRAASALSADAAISQFDMKAAEAYDKAAAAYASGDESSAELYAAAAVGFVNSSTAALRQSSVPRCH